MTGTIIYLKVLIVELVLQHTQFIYTQHASQSPIPVVPALLPVHEEHGHAFPFQEKANT